MLFSLYINRFFSTIVFHAQSIYSKWRLMDRYILKELIKTHLTTLLFLYIILLINNFLVMAETLLSLSVGILQILGLIISLTPSTLIWALPFSSLIGSLLAIGRMATDNEITAACFLGCTYYQLLRPFLMYGICLCLTSFFIMNVLSPNAEKLFQKIMQNIGETTPHVLIESNSSQKLGDVILMVGKISGSEVDGITIIDTDTLGYKRVIYAKKAYFVQSHKNKGLTFILENVQGISAVKEIRRLDYQRIYASGAEYRVHVRPEQLEKMTTFSGKTLYETWENLQKSDQHLKENREIRKEQSLDWLGALSDNYLNSLIFPDNSHTEISILYERYLNALPSNKPDTRYRSNFIDFYQQLSLPLACFIFVLLAFSLAISTKKAHQTTMLALGVIFSMIYWFLLYLTIHLVIVGQFDLWVAGGADMAFFLLTIILFARIKK